MDGGQSIYRTVREIKKSENSLLYNALRSIYEDSIFVGEISQLWPLLPVLTNLRCGLWYSSRFHASCYFKSTDGHCNNWSFNTSRLNLHVALLAGQKGGCIIVDSTRKGKRFPDSMSRTLPIWTCVLNRAICNHRKLMNQNTLMQDIDQDISSNAAAENTSETSLEWDCSLHLPLWISKTEKSSIENRLEEWTKNLESSGADIASLSETLKKPLRPLWISQQSVIWLNEVPDHDSWDFTPIILVSASASTGGVYQQKTSSEFSWSYISGAGDDEETWARGLTPTLFWKHAYDLINIGPGLCNHKVAEIVEKDRVYRAQRGENAPQITINGRLSVDKDVPLPSEFTILNIQENSSDEDCVMYWLGSTNIAVGSTQLATTTPQVDCILNVDKESVVIGTSYTYLHLPTLNSKFDRFSLLRNLPSSVDFAKENLSQGKALLVCCSDGEDISICVCLAILISLFDEEGSFIGEGSSNKVQITKWDMRKQLVNVCKYATNARPSRGNLKQVFSFLNGGSV